MYPRGSCSSSFLFFLSSAGSPLIVLSYILFLFTFPLCFFLHVRGTLVFFLFIFSFTYHPIGEFYRGAKGVRVWVCKITFLVVYGRCGGFCMSNWRKIICSPCLVLSLVSGRGNGSHKLCVQICRWGCVARVTCRCCSRGVNLHHSGIIALTRKSFLE